MNPRLYLPVIAATSLILPMCQNQDEGPQPAGMVKASDPVADRLFQEAMSLDKQGKPSKAISPLEKIVRYHELSPIAPRARYMLGQMYEKTEDYRQAFKEYGKVITHYHSSDYYTPALNRQLALAFDAASGKMQTPVLWGAWRTDMESAVVEEWLQSIVANAPYNEMAATALSVLAKYQLRNNKPERARATYSKLAESYPESRMAPGALLMVAELWANERARSNNDLVNITKAQEAYEEFTLRYPNHADAEKARGQVQKMRRALVSQDLEVGRYYLERAREYSAAIQCFRNVIAQEKVNPQAAQEARILLDQAQRLAAAAS